jgi:hypothetical protein
MIAEITVTKTESPASSVFPALSASQVSSDSLSSFRSAVSFDLAYRLVWVHTPLHDGVRHYEVLPSGMADTLPAAQRFISDTRRLLSTVDTVFIER